MLFDPKGKGQRGLQARPGEKDAAEFQPGACGFTILSLGFKIRIRDHVIYQHIP
jgi:hypothetical protein